MSVPEGPCPGDGSSGVGAADPAEAVRARSGSAGHLAAAGSGAPPPEFIGLDLARLLIRDPQRCLLLRVSGDSMQGAGIHHGDLLVVERQARAASGAIVVARLGERFTLKRWRRYQGRCWLEAAHPAYPPLDLESTARRLGLMPSQVQVWGVAIHVIRAL